MKGAEAERKDIRMNKWGRASPAEKVGSEHQKTNRKVAAGRAKGFVF